MTLVFSIFLWAVGASGSTYISDMPTTVYKAPSTESEVLGTLRAGRRVESEPHGRRWLKIMLKTPKGRVTGYVLVQPPSPKKEGVEGLMGDGDADFFNGWRVGFFHALSSYSQASRVFQDGDGLESDIGRLTGANNYSGLLIEWPWSQKLYVRVAWAMRKIDLNGVVRYRSGAVSTTDTPVRIEQEFTSFIVGAKYALWWNFWVGTFFEWANATSSKVFGAEAEKPTYFIVQPALGLDLKVWKGLWIQPEFRLGMFLNTKPFMFNPESVLAVGWAF